LNEALVGLVAGRQSWPKRGPRLVSANLEIFNWRGKAAKAQAALVMARQGDFGSVYRSKPMGHPRRFLLIRQVAAAACQPPLPDATGTFADLRAVAGSELASVGAVPQGPGNFLRI